MEIVRAVGQTERLERGFPAVRIRSDEREFAQVRHQYETIAIPVACYLIANGPGLRVLVRGLHLHHAAFRNLSLARLALLYLLRRVETEVGMPGTLIGQLANAEHFRFERGADGVQQRCERRVTGSFSGSSARCMHPPKFLKVGLDR